jgi:hypothetical protein
MSPFLKQAKSVAWDYLRAAVAEGRQAGASIHESELRVDYPGGAQVRLFGADNADALRGLYLDGIVLDEHADMDPRVWPEVIRPALADRRGWAVFIGTPKGRNAFFEMWRRAQSDPGWFALMLKASETGLIPEEELKVARRDLSGEQYAQEFECSFDAAVIGAYYGRLMREAKEQKRIANVPCEPSLPVWTAWDLGIADATAIWFAQVVGREIRIIDYYESSGVELAHYVRELQKRDYLYAGHIVPHDAQAKELGTGKSRIELMQSLGLRNVTLAPTHFVEDGIEAVQYFCPNAGSMRASAPAASMRWGSIAPNTMTSERRSSRVRCTTGPRMPPTPSAISPWRSIARSSARRSRARSSTPRSGWCERFFHTLSHGEHGGRRRACVPRRNSGGLGLPAVSCSF